MNKDNPYLHYHINLAFHLKAITQLFLFTKTLNEFLANQILQINNIPSGSDSQFVKNPSSLFFNLESLMDYNRIYKFEHDINYYNDA